MKEDLGFSWTIDKTLIPESNIPVEKVLFVLKKLHAEYVWDIVQLEGNPYSFLEVQTLLDGTTIAGHSLSDQHQVLNQSASLKNLALVVKDKKELDKMLILSYHKILAKEEALKWGCFRDGQVAISGTEYLPPKSDKLPALFSKGLQNILDIECPVERGLVYHFFGSLNQFFYDGNKRTSRLVMNTILMQHGLYYLSVPGSRKKEYDELMVQFYNSKDATNCMSFLLSCYKDHGV